MRPQRVAVALTAINSVLLLAALTQNRPAAAQQDMQVLRGRGLEIVDDRGRLRAQIILLPASTRPDGQRSAETVLLRLIDPNGRPAVKLGGSADGSGMSLAGDSERRQWSGVQILASGVGSSVKLTNKDGREQQIAP